MFQNELDVDETLAQLLVAEGFGAMEEVAYVELDELAGIEGFDEDLATELQSRARKRLNGARKRRARSAAGSASRTSWPKCRI
jgi:N utilization substance protein A